MVRDLPAPLGAGATTSTPGPGGHLGIAARRRLGLEPPRFCAECGRRMVVQVRPDGWWAKCSGTAGWTPPTWKRGDERAPFG
ncbi:hypothetical protein I553_9839 [Mycobacterium xenopi 4042]|uniref:Biotin synthase auxiliary protein n=1 Tax=Mycobacterium xenopi 4042 TaxID=1299334 RepID=X7YNN4_MYCXE|nr:hypothetical protein I553_9839 [Mycobacterium xenopi 4042]